jgi:hypothetical protein
LFGRLIPCRYGLSYLSVLHLANTDCPRWAIRTVLPEHVADAVVVARVVAGKYSPSYAVVRAVLLFVAIVMWQVQVFCSTPGGKGADGL